MKTLKKLVVFIILLTVISFIGLNYIQVKADGEPIQMVPGASIRTTGTQGLKFSATFDETVLNALVNPEDIRGFFIMYGVATIADLETAAGKPNPESEQINGKSIKREANYDKTTPTISVVLTGIPISGYSQDITVVGFSLIGGVYTFTPTVVTRSVSQVRNAAIEALAIGKTAQYPGTKNSTSLQLMIDNHGFSGYTLVHGDKMLFFGYKSYISLRAMEGEETVLPWQVVQPYTVDTAAFNFGVNKTGQIAAGTNGTGALYYNGNSTNVVVSSKELYGIQHLSSGYTYNQYGVILVGSNGVIKTNFAGANLVTGIQITLSPGDYLITSFEADRFALGGPTLCYYQGADFAVGQTVTITYNSYLVYGG